MAQSRSRMDVLVIVLAALMILVGIILVFGVAPTADRLSGGDVQRIFYFHVGIAWIAGLAMFVTFISSILYLCARRAAQVRHRGGGVGGDRRGVRLDGAGCLACCGRGRCGIRGGRGIRA